MQALNARQLRAAGEGQIDVTRAINAAQGEIAGIRSRIEGLTALAQSIASQATSTCIRLFGPEVDEASGFVGDKDASRSDLVELHEAISRLERVLGVVSAKVDALARL